LEKNNLAINSLSDLNGLVAVVIRGTSYGMLLDEYFASEASVIQVTQGEQRIDILLTGKADYLIHSPVGAAVDFQGRVNPEQVRMSEEPLSWEEVSMAFSRTSPCRRLVPDVNRLILEKRFGSVDS
jgi:ABC-type amino acid transport substrate-binding protein